MRANQPNGFSLTYVAIIMVVASLIAIGALTSISSKNTADQSSITQQKLNKIKESLINYLALNGRLPCPSSANINTESRDSNFVCNGSGITSNEFYFEGNVPYASLNLKENDVIDGYGRRIVYSISNNLQISATDQLGNNFLNAQGNIVVSDNVNSFDNVAFALISFGKDGQFSSRSKDQNLYITDKKVSDDIVVFLQKNNLSSQCFQKSNRLECLETQCLNQADVLFWNRGMKNISKDKNVLAIFTNSTTPELNLTGNILYPSDSYTISMTIEEMDNIDSSVSLYYEYTNLMEEKSQTVEVVKFSTSDSSAKFSASDIGTTVSISFGSSGQIPKRLFFKQNLESSKSKAVLTLSDISLSYNSAAFSNSLNYQSWNNFKFQSVYDIINSSLYPLKADFNSLSGRAVFPVRQDSPFVERIYGYFIPNKTGDYIFALNSNTKNTQFISVTSDYSLNLIQFQQSNDLLSSILNLFPLLLGQINSYNVTQPISLVAGTQYFIQLFNMGNSPTNSELELKWSFNGGSFNTFSNVGVYNLDEKIQATELNCSSGYTSQSKELSYPENAQKADIIDLKNHFGRFLKISLNSSYAKSKDTSNNMSSFFLRQIRVIDSNGEIIDPESFSILYYNTALANKSDSLLPNNLFTQKDIKESSYEFKSSTEDAYGYMTTSQSSPQFVIIDLKKTYQIKEVWIWNGNQIYTDQNGQECCSGRAVKNVTADLSNSINHLLFNPSRK